MYLSKAGSPNSEINCRCEKHLHPLRIAGRLEAFASFVLFVQDKPFRRFSGFTSECRTWLLAPSRVLCSTAQNDRLDSRMWSPRIHRRGIPPSPPCIVLSMACNVVIPILILRGILFLGTPPQEQ